MRDLVTAKAIGKNPGNDCYQFTAEVVFAVTGRDFRGRFEYRNAREWKRVIRKGGSLAALARDVLGDPCEPCECDDGDPVIVRAGKEMLGVRYQGTVVVKTRKFVQALPLDFAVMGWKL